MARAVAMIAMAFPSLALAGPATQGDDVAAALAATARPFADKLASPEMPIRVGAIRDLGRLGPAARSAAGPLLRAAKEVAVRDEVVKTLGKLGPAAQPDLTAALIDDDPFYRVAVLRAMAAWPAVAVEQTLVRRLAEQFDKDAPGELRVAAAGVVARMARGAKEGLGFNAPVLIANLIASLAGPERDTQPATAAALAAVGKPAVPALVKGLAHRSVAVRTGCAEALGLIGPAAGPEAVAVLTDWLGSDLWRSRLAAAEALGRMGEAAQPAVAKLIEIAWKRPPPEPPKDAKATDAVGPLLAHQAAEKALIQLGPLAAPAKTLLVAVIDDVESPRRLAAVETLAAIGPAAADQLPLMLQLLAEPAGPMPVIVVKAIAGFGEPAVKAAGDLLNQPGENPRLAGIGIAHRLGPKAAPLAGALAKLIAAESTTWAVRVAAVDAVAAIGPAANVDGLQAALLGLIRPLKTEELEREGDLRHKAFNALAALGTAAVPPLTALLDSSDAAIRGGAVGTLAGLGPAAAPAAAKLAERLGDASESVRLLAPVTLGKLGADALAPVTAALASPDARTRAAAADAAGRLGADAAKTAPRLIELLSDKDAKVRSAAAWALGQCPPTDAPRDALKARLADPAEAAHVRATAAAGLAGWPNPTAALVRDLSALLADPKLSDAAFDALRSLAAGR